jgi:telomerase reverse transcriptase
MADVLRSLFGEECYVLHEYLSSLGVPLPPPSTPITPLTSLLTVARVAPLTPCPTPVPPPTRSSSLSDLVHSVVLSLVQKSRAVGRFSGTGEGHCLALGFRMRKWGSEGAHVAGLPMLEAFHPNSSVNHVLSEGWLELHEAVGDAVLTHLLRDCVVLLERGNGCLVQVSGPLLPDLVRAKREAALASAGAGRRRSHFVLPRNLIFYANTARYSPGLPRRHPLSVLPASRQGARQLAAEVFRVGGALKHRRELQRQVRVAHERGNLAFQYKAAQQATPVKRDVRHLPAHVVPLLPMLERLIKAHKALPYGALLRRHCPLPEAAEAPSLLEAATPPRQVEKFIFDVLGRLLPPSLAGKVMREAVRKFVRLRRFERVTVEHLAEGFSVRAIFGGGEAGDPEPEPAAAGARSAARARVPASLAVARQRSAAKLVCWVFTSLVIPLLRAHFYATETEPFRNRVLYFLKPVWRRAAQAEMARITSGGMYVALAGARGPSEVLPAARMRLLPKASGMRPIVNLKGAGANRTLQTVFHVLTAEKERGGGILLGLNDVHERLGPFVRGWRARGCPRLYAVSLDFQKCFDTIEHAKLLRVMSEVMTADQYAIMRYGVVHAAMGSPRVRWERLAVEFGAHPQFVEFSEELCERFRGAIFTDQVVYSDAQAETLWRLLVEHITGNQVEIGEGVFEQRRGIPQGSVLSSLLCSFLFRTFEREVLGFVDPGEDLLMRLIDDSLFLTTSRARALQFMDAMHRPHPDYGCIVNPSKTRCNFDPADRDGSGGGDASADPVVPWVGLLLDTAAPLTVTPDFARLEGGRLEDSLTLECFERCPGAALASKAKRLLKVKCHPIFLDTALTARSVVLASVHEMALYAARRFVRSVSALRSASNTAFLVRTCRDSARYMSWLVKNAVDFSSSAAKAGASCSLEPKEIERVTTEAFVKAFRARQTRFRAVLVFLEDR